MERTCSSTCLPLNADQPFGFSDDHVLDVPSKGSIGWAVHESCRNLLTTAWAGLSIASRRRKLALEPGPTRRIAGNLSANYNSPAMTHNPTSLIPPPPRPRVRLTTRLRLQPDRDRLVSAARASIASGICLFAGWLLDNQGAGLTANLGALAALSQVATLVLAGGAISWTLHMLGALWQRRGPEHQAVANAACAVADFIDRGANGGSDLARHKAATALHDAWRALIAWQPVNADRKVTPIGIFGTPSSH
jgi:hypothetical protein